MWDQLNQCVAYGNRSLWVTNAGDLKGNELPAQFFLKYAWDPGRWTPDRLPEWEERYAGQNSGEKEAAAVASVLRTYARLQSRRKPELLNRKITLDLAKDPAEDGSAIVHDDRATPFSIVDYREPERYELVAQWARHTSDNVNITSTVHRIAAAGVHVLKFWMVDPTVVLQNLVVDTGGLKPSYLGPPESLRLH